MKLRFFLPVVLLLSLSACSNRAAKLPHYGHIPPFTMTASDGKPFDSRQLQQKVWVADFIYTNCPGPCPMMTSQMHQVQRKLIGNPDVMFVSISVDPDRDTPPVLDAFAHRFGGPASDWVFLTGSTSTVHELARNAFKLGDVITRLEHSTRFAVVDKKGEIRGYYSTFDPDSQSGMLDDINALAAGG